MAHRWHSLLALVFSIVVFGGCKKPPLVLEASGRVDSLDVIVSVDINDPNAKVVVVSDPAAPKDPRTLPMGHRDFRLDKSELKPGPDGFVHLTVKATRGKEVVTRDVAISKEALGVDAAAGKGGAPSGEDSGGVQPVEQPSADKPIVLAAFTRDGESGAKLTGTLGERLDVSLSPLKLTFAALPEATLRYRGKPLAFDKGKAELVVERQDLILDAPPAEMIATRHKPWIKLSLEQEHGGATRELALYLEPSGKSGLVNDVLGAVIGVAEGKPLQASGPRQGGLLIVKDPYQTRLLVAKAPTATRSLAAVGFAERLPAARSPSKVCRYSGGYSESYYRVDIKLLAYDAATGKKLGERVVAGQPPRTCPFTITTFGNSRSGTMSSVATDDQVLAAFTQLGKLR